MASGKIATLILAGGVNKPEMREACDGLENRALVPLNGRPMLDYIVAAVRGAGEATENGRVLVAGDVPLPEGCIAVAGGASMIDTLFAGVAALQPDETRLLVVTADVPFLTSAALVNLAAKAAALGTGVDFVYPVVPAGLCEARFPGMRRTTLRIAEGTFTGGNVVLLDPAFLRRSDAVLRAAYERRKSVSALAKLLGPQMIFRLAGARLFPGLLTIPLLEAAVGRLLGGAVARAVITEFPEIGADVDKPEDLAIAEKILRENI